MKSRMAMLFSSTFLVIFIGCSGNKLETGYTYTPLGDSPAKRRGYYADPFSPEARAAQNEKTSDVVGHRPVPGE